MSERAELIGRLKALGESVASVRQTVKVLREIGVDFSREELDQIDGALAEAAILLVKPVVICGRKRKPEPVPACQDVDLKRTQPEG